MGCMYFFKGSLGLYFLDICELFCLLKMGWKGNKCAWCVVFGIGRSIIESERESWKAVNLTWCSNFTDEKSENIVRLNDQTYNTQLVCAEKIQLFKDSRLSAFSFGTAFFFLTFNSDFLNYYYWGYSKSGLAWNIYYLILIVLVRQEVTQDFLNDIVLYVQSMYVHVYIFIFI